MLAHDIRDLRWTSCIWDWMRKERGMAGGGRGVVVLGGKFKGQRNGWRNEYLK